MNAHSSDKRSDIDNQSLYASVTSTEKELPPNQYAILQHIWECASMMEAYLRELDLLSLIIEMFSSTGSDFVPLTVIARELDSHFSILDDKTEWDKIADPAGFKRSVLQEIMRRNDAQAGRYWSDEEYDQLIKMHVDNYSDEEIAAILNRSTWAVRAARKRIRIVREHQYWSDSEVQTLIQMVENGATVPEIANRLSRSTASIQGMKQRLNLTVGRHLPSNLLAQIEELFNSGFTDAEIASQLNITHDSVGYVRRTYDLNHYKIHPWTQEEDQILTNAFGEGLSDEQIAMQILPNRSISAIQRRRYQLDLKHNNTLTPEIVETIISLYNSRNSIHRISVILSIDRRKIKKLLESLEP
jgi:transposase